MPAAVLARAERASPTRQALFLAAATVACLGPFLAKPLHLDDPLFFWAARQIAVRPSDPYGVTINWYGIPQRLADVTNNPPGVSYYMAVAGSLFGWSPVALHAAFLLPAVTAVIATWALARRLCRRPVLAALLVLTAPGFLVSATTLMADVTMLALWLVAVFLWVDGIERDRFDLLVAAGVVAGACVLVKYSGVAVVGLCALYALARRGAGRWAIALVPSLVIVVLYQVWSGGLYGQGHLSDAVSYAAREREPASVHGGLVAVAHLGAAIVAAAPLMAVVLDRRRVALVVGLAVAATAFLLVDGQTWWQRAAEAKDWGTIAAHFLVFVAAGVAVLLLALCSDWWRGDAVALLLVSWIVGMELFAGFINWTSNVRSVLPAVPAAALVMTRALDARAPRMLTPVLVGSLVLGLWVAAGDYAVARAQVRAAERIRERTAGLAGTLWFEGHWGFQPAMEAIGGRAVHVVETRFFPGDALVIPRRNTNTFDLPASVPTRLDPIDVPLGLGATTICNRCGAGFYSSSWGPIAYRIDPPPPERFDVFHILDAPER